MDQFGLTATLSHKLSIFSDGSYELVRTPPAVTRWRVLHDIEMPRGVWRAGMPEVHPLYPNHHSPFQAWAQVLSFQINPWLTPELWTKVYHYRYWISNNQGYGMSDAPRANFVLSKNVTEELPRVEALVCGGSLISGERVGDYVKVNGLHYGDPVTLDYLQAHPEYWVRGVYAGGTGQPFRMLGDKYDGPAFIHPLIVNGDKGDLYIEVAKLQEWTALEPPDPLKVYL